MLERTIELDFPGWLPRGAILVAASLYGAFGDGDQDTREHLMRFINDERMRRVWQELRKPTRRVDYVRTTSRWLQRFGKMPTPEHCGNFADPPLDERELAYGLYFYAGWFPSAFSEVTNLRITSEAEHARIAKLFDLQEKEREIADLRVNARAAARIGAADAASMFDRAADFLEEVLAPFKPYVVLPNDIDDRNARACAIWLACQAQRYFGECLYSTVATTVTVALGLTKKLSGQRVRDWAHGPSR
jgi:hypothetical protein